MTVSQRWEGTFPVIDHKNAAASVPLDNILLLYDRLVIPVTSDDNGK